VPLHPDPLASLHLPLQVTNPQSVCRISFAFRSRERAEVEQAIQLYRRPAEYEKE
jgi:hypothetical protein